MPTKITTPNRLPCVSNIIKLIIAQKRRYTKQQEKAELGIFFLKKARRKDRRESLSKKVLQKSGIYGILYRKLAAE